MRTPWRAVVVLALALAACGETTPASGAPDAGATVSEHRQVLKIVADERVVVTDDPAKATVFALPHERLTLRVRASDEADAPLAKVAVTFEAVSGATLAEPADGAASTGNDGIASVVIDAGALAADATTAVKASLASGASVSFELHARAADPARRKLQLDEIAVFQAVKTSIVKNGALVPPSARNAPVVAGKPALVRAYATPLPGGDAEPITARLVLESSAGTFALTQANALAKASADADASSVFSFEVPAEQVTADARFRLDFSFSDGVPVADAAGLARFPADGSAAPLGALEDGGGIELVLVPSRYDTDGSGRLPDTSPEQLERFRSVLAALYPLAHVQLTVHAPVSWTRSLTLTGNVNFGAMNSMLIDLRTRESPGRNACYYALVDAAADFDSYCGGSCVTGQSYVPDDASDADSRVGSGVGFTGESTAWTLAHEVGHELGRTHAPCGTRGADADYPYAGAQIGVWGRDARSNTFFAPSAAKDFMSYCDPTWTSDYTNRGIFERVRAIASLPPWGAGVLSRRPYALVRRDAAGRLAREGGASFGRPPGRAVREGRFLAANGAVMATFPVQRLFEGDGADERVYAFPEPPAGAAIVRFAAGDGVPEESWQVTR